VTQLLTAKEVAPLLRFNERTVKNLASEGKIPGAVRVGREWRFQRTEIERLIGQPVPVPKEGSGEVDA
jgi:excisionase family DNA binding protein